MTPDTNGTESTVMIVEDEKPLADLYTRWLEDDHEVRTCYSGVEAIERLDDAGVDVLLLDRLLPQKSGDRVLEEVRETAPFCQVAMISSVQPDVDVAHLPIDEYFFKPVERAKLQAGVRELLARTEMSVTRQRLLGMVSRRIALEAEQPQEELERSDQYGELVRRIEAVAERLSVNPENISSAYRPDACPECDLRWDVDIDGVVGFVRLASSVWKCSNCGEIVERYDDGGRVVNR